MTSFHVLALRLIESPAFNNDVKMALVVRRWAAWSDRCVFIHRERMALKWQQLLTSNN